MNPKKNTSPSSSNSRSFFHERTVNGLSIFFAICSTLLILQGCAKWRGGKKGESQALYAQLLERGEPKWEATGDADVDVLGQTVVTQWGNSTFQHIRRLRAKVEGQREYGAIQHELHAQMQKGLTEQAAYADVKGRCDSSDPGLWQRFIAYDREVEPMRSIALSEIGKILPRLVEARQSYSNLKSKFSEGGLSLSGFMAKKAILSGLKNIVETIDFIKDCNMLISRTNQLAKTWK